MSSTVGYQVAYFINDTADDTPPVEKVRLINTGFDAFMVIANACDPTRNLEYRIVAVTLYNGAAVIVSAEDHGLITPQSFSKTRFRIQTLSDRPYSRSRSSSSAHLPPSPATPDTRR